MNTLTIGTALFVFFILIPGYVIMGIKGRSIDNSKALLGIIYNGTFNFFILFLLMSLISVIKQNQLVNHFIGIVSGNF